MKKHELLKFAYDNYPKGTKFTWPKDTIKTEFESLGSFVFKYEESYGWNIYSNSDLNLCVYNGEEWAEIVKPKIAVRVENEKEFKAIEKYLGKKSFFTPPFQTVSYPAFIYLDGGKYPCQEFVSLDCEEIYLKGYQIIPFSQFAAEHNIKLPLLVSEDGVDLYEGYIYVLVSKNKEKWEIFTESARLKDYAKVISGPELHKAFSTKQAALDWIEAQKPKNVIISPNSGYPIIVYRKPVCGDEYIHLDMSKRGDYNGANIHLTIDELRQAVKAYDEMHS